MNDLFETLSQSWRLATDAGMSPITRRVGIDPYDLTELAAPDECEYCDEGADLETIHRHAFYSNDSDRQTPESLMFSFLKEVASLTTYAIPAAVVSGSESIDAVEALNDECNYRAEYALSDAGFYVIWEGGYVIGEVIEATETELAAIAESLGAEHGKNAGSWTTDGNTTRETALRIYEGLRDGDPEVVDLLPSPPNADAVDSWHSSEATELERVALRSDAGADAYYAAFSQACEDEVGRACALILDSESGLVFEDYDVCAHCARGIRVQELSGHPNDGEWVHVWSGDYFAGNRARCLDNIDNIAEPAAHRSVVKFAWPGGYRVWYVCDDSGQLCAECCTENLELIRTASRGDGWRVEGHYNEGDSDESGPCDNCGRESDTAREETEEATS